MIGRAGFRFHSVGVVWGAALLALIGIGAWWFAATQWDSAGNVTMQGMAAQIRAWGSWAALASIALMVLHSFLPFPSEFITLANGMVFGPLWGSLITWVGAMLGAISTFALVRWLGRPFVCRMLNAGQLRRLDAWSSRQGGTALLIGRLIPVIAFNLLNYAAALTAISWWTFIWATGLGILPLTIALNVFGAELLKMRDWNWVWWALGALVFLGWYLVQHRAKAKLS